MNLTTIPSPETLRPLLEAGLALMEANDPAKEELSVSIRLHSQHKPSVRIVCFPPDRENIFANGSTPEEALEDFRRQYPAPLTIEREIAELEARIAKLRGGKQ